MVSELLCTTHKNVNDLARGQLWMGRKAKATSGCLINAVRVRPHCPCRPRYLGRPYGVAGGKWQTNYRTAGRLAP